MYASTTQSQLEALPLNVMVSAFCSNASINTGAYPRPPPIMILFLSSNRLSNSLLSSGTGVISMDTKIKSKVTLDLLHLEVLNIQMDTNAKWWWETLSQAQHHPILSLIPGERWSIWLNWCKLATFNQTIFDLHTQYHYSCWYWKQSTKLRTLYETIDWHICGKARKNFPLAQQLWSTKWMTNWLPVANNMLHWNMWPSNLCPSCIHAIEDANHVIHCPDPSCTTYLLRKLLN